MYLKMRFLILNFWIFGNFWKTRSGTYNDVFIMYKNVKSISILINIDIKNIKKEEIYFSKLLGIVEILFFITILFSLYLSLTFRSAKRCCEDFNIFCRVLSEFSKLNDIYIIILICITNSSRLILQEIKI